MRYAAEKAESIAQKLRALPPKKTEHNLNRREMVNVLASEIHELQNRGYTLEDIGETLRGEGFDIATPTLRTYLHTNQSNQHTNRRRKTQKKTRITPEEMQNAKSTAKVEATAPATEGKKAEEGAGKGRFTVRPDTVDI